MKEEERWRGKGNPSILLYLIFLRLCFVVVAVAVIESFFFRIFFPFLLKFNCDNPLVCWYDMADLLEAATVFGLAVSELEARLWTVLLQKGQLFGIDGTTSFPASNQSSSALVKGEINENL